MGKFLLKLFKYILKFIDDLPVIGPAKKFAKENLESTLLLVFILFLIYLLYQFRKKKNK
jgi:flagellar biogenesis protein FliO